MWETLTVNKNVRFILGRLNERGHEAYIVGGAVRDLLLGRDPKDFDISTSATPQEIKDAFGRSARIIGRRFRLAHVRIDRVCYEVSTFRREPTVEERTSREGDDGVMIWRDNQYGNLEQDALRRDFTVNALYFSPLSDPPYRDFCQGLRDLEAGVVRAIGPPATRLAEDPVRIIRALKLTAEYGFRLSEELIEPLGQSASMLHRCSKARLFEELLKIFQKPYSSATFGALHQHHGLAAFLPAMSSLWSSPTGECVQGMLAIRDARLSKPNYSNSRALALATACYASACDKLGVEAGDLWSYSPGLERALRDAVIEFFYPLPVPRVLTARTRDVLLLLPRFRQNRGRQKLVSHPEYRYARELYSILTEYFGWDAKRIDGWPVMGTGHPYRNRSRKGRRGNRRRKPDNKS